MKFRQRLGAAFRMLFDAHRAQFLSGEDVSGGGTALAGVDVNGTTALQFSAFFSGVQQISQTVASLPLPVFRRTGEGRERERSHPLTRLLNTMSNEWTAAFIWREVMTHHAIVWGNGYSRIIRDRAQRPIELRLLNPERMKVGVEDGRIVYKLRRLDGTSETIEKADVFHVPGLGFDGLQGYSLLTVARESIGSGLAMQEFTARFYGQGTHVGAVVKRPREAAKLDKDTAERLVRGLALAHSGLGKSHSVMLLEEGMEYETVGMPLKDAEFLASKVFSIQDMARFLNMPPHKLKDLSHGTFSNIEHEQLSWVIDTIRPWCVRWEAHVNSQLFSPAEQGVLFAEHIMDALLRGDIVSRYNALAVARQNGIINANEWRRMENWNPIEGQAGEAYLVNGNMIRTDRAPAASLEAEQDQEETEDAPGEE